MTLPSQFARPTSRHSHMFRRRRGGRKAFVGVLLGLLLLVVIVWKWFGPGQDTPAIAFADNRSSESAELEQPHQTQQRPSSQQTRPSATNAQPSSSSQSAPNSAPNTTENPPVIQMGGSVSSGTLPAAQSSSAQPANQPTSPPPAATQPTTSPPPVTSPARTRAMERMRVGMDMLASNRPVDARLMLTQALDSGALDARSAQTIRDTLSELNERLVFSPEIVAGDPFAFGYTIRPGDALSRLPRSQNVATDWRFIQRINRIQRPEAIRAGQNIKLVSGPFHAVVYKRQFRMDIYMGDEGARVFVRSFNVGLGEYDSTPVGTFRVRPNSKLINPEWTNPRTGERFLPDDPLNPIGEHWIGLEGISEGVRDLGGYGIHGTIEPDSIGRQASMGCVRMQAEDVELVYELLVENASTVTIIDK
jgi:lipoprotein-anchoring transpeptidase ErfK/SrfK